MSAPASSEPHLTGDDLLAMGDIGPCELIDGRIVPLSPTGGEHGTIEVILAGELSAFVRPRRLGWVLAGEAGIYTRRRPDRVRGVDVAFISRRRLPSRPGERFLEVAPELMVEILDPSGGGPWPDRRASLSPDDRWPDVRQKIDEYFAIGVDRVWVVEPEHRAVLVYRSALEFDRLGATDTLRGEGPLDGFALPVAVLFEE